MKRIIVFTFGIASYLVFLVTFLYAVGFIGNFGVPKTLDSPSSTPLTVALLIDAGLLALFAVQHSVMARRGFKRMITQLIPQAAERSLYVLASSVALLLLFWKWEPLGGTIWALEDPTARMLAYAGYAAGWLLVFVTTFVINHFDLFGLRQVWRHMLQQPQARLRFTMPLLYRVVRHPLYVGWLMVFWATPSMTVTHLFFAVMTTGYILIAIRFEEADLIHEHPEYAAYREQVPMLVPGLPRTVLIDAPPKRTMA